MAVANRRGGTTKREGAPLRIVRVVFERCDALGIELRQAVGFEVNIGGKWSAVPALRNQTLQLACALELDVGAAVGIVLGAGVGAIVGASGSNDEDTQRTGGYSLRYNWFRSTCFANETKDGQGAGRCAVYSGGLPAPPFRIAITAWD
jgi:hypothetical protein